MSRAGAPFFVDGSPALGTIELFESSGPVSPRFHYDVELRVTVTKEGIDLVRRASHGGSAPLERVSRLSRPDYEALVDHLVALGVLDAPRDLIGDAGRAKTGVSFNHVALTFPGLRVRIDYTRASLERPDAEGARRVVDALKELALAP